MLATQLQVAFEDAYSKASASSKPDDWMNAALFAKQFSNAYRDESQHPATYQYLYSSPFGDGDVWRSESGTWNGQQPKAWRALFSVPARGDAPIDMVLHCPNCGLQHIDAPDEPGSAMAGLPVWTNPPHRSHKCHGCGHIWRPADVPTNGVSAVKTKGKNDSPITGPDQLGHVGASVSHPPQPLIRDAYGTIRFKQNDIVRFLLDHGPHDMNAIGSRDFPREDRVQFAQLIGYSLDGFSTLSYVNDEDYQVVEAGQPKSKYAEALSDMLDEARAELDMLRAALRVPVEPHQSLIERMIAAARKVNKRTNSAVDIPDWETVRDHLAMYLSGVTGRKSQTWHGDLDVLFGAGALGKWREMLTPTAGEQEVRHG